MPARSRKVESLMKGILQDIQLLANNRALDEATRDKMKATVANLFIQRTIKHANSLITTSFCKG
ncbi:hypothetical protein QBC32DRAFT_319382, partial [Pseudoneurospora amorphoporcata]